MFKKKKNNNLSLQSTKLKQRFPKTKTEPMTNFTKFIEFIFEGMTLLTAMQRSHSL